MSHLKRAPMRSLWLDYLVRSFDNFLGDMTSFRRQAHSVSSGQPNRRPEPLSEQRYQDLLKNASAFFASAVDATEDEREAVIGEINELMKKHALTVDDLK